jgi:serine/threonine protein kinase
MNVFKRPHDDCKDHDVYIKFLKIHRYSALNMACSGSKEEFDESPENNNVDSEVMESELSASTALAAIPILDFDFSQAVIGSSEIGSGASSRVYHAYVPNKNVSKSKVGNSPVKPVVTDMVIKILHPIAASDAYFERECASLVKIQKLPYVIKFHGALNRSIFFEFCPHGELFYLINKFEGKVPLILVRLFLRQLWSTLADCHSAGVYHRDIKPENILLAKDWTIRLADFGAALYCGEKRARKVFGSGLYKAPEVVQNKIYNPAATDVWSAAVTTFVLVYGVLPFSESSNKCRYFKCARKGKWNQFWKQHEVSQRYHPVPSASTKQFLQRGLVVQADKRPAASAILAEKWLAHGEVCSDVASFMALHETN